MEFLRQLYPPSAATVACDQQHIFLSFHWEAQTSLERDILMVRLEEILRAELNALGFDYAGVAIEVDAYYGEQD